MGIRANFTIDDLELPHETETLGIPIDYSEGMETFAETFFDEARDMVPIDTGYLASSIGYEWDGIGCSCWADADYAQYVEYGTIYMSPQPYFEPALLIAFSSAMPIWQEAIEEAQAEEQRQLEEQKALTLTYDGATFGFPDGVNMLMGIAGIIGAILLVAFAIATINFFQNEISAHFAQFTYDDNALFDSFNVEIY